MQEKFLNLLAAARAGRPGAADELYSRFGQYLKLRARCKMRRMEHLAAVYDAEDLHQSTWRSFFAHHLLEQDFAGPEQFLAYLSGMMERKALEARRRMECRKRDVRRVVSFETLGEAVREMIDPKEPDPADVLIAEDEWEQLLKAQFNPALPKLLRLFRKGYTQQEVADILRCSVRTIRRMLRQVQLPDGSRAFPYMSSFLSPEANDRDMNVP